MERLMTGSYSGCLCNPSATTGLISFKNLLMNCIKTENFASVIYQPLEMDMKIQEDSKDIQWDNLILLQIFLQEVFLKKNSMDSVCGESFKILSHVLKTSNMLEEMKKIIFAENALYHYTTAKLISSIVLALPEDNAKFYLKSLGSELTNKNSEMFTITVISLFQKLFQFSSITPHLFPEFDEIKNKAQVCQNFCMCQMKRPVRDFGSVKNFASQILLNNLPYLIQKTSEFRMYTGDDVNWLLKKEIEHYPHCEADSVFNFNFNLEVNGTNPDKKSASESEFYLYSILHLWQSFVDYLKDNSSLDQCNILQYQESWNWMNILKIIIHSPLNMAILLLNILNSSLPYQTLCQSNLKLCSLPMSILQASQLGYFEYIASKPVFLWSFIGVVDSCKETVITRFSGNILLQKFIFLVLKSLVFLKENDNFIDLWMKSLERLLFYMETWKLTWITYFFSDQDDSLIEAMLCCLDIYKSLPWNKQEQYDLFLNPNCIFKCFVESIQFDHQVILDFLTSNETNFLLYFLRYLKFLHATLVQKKAFNNPQSSETVDLSLPCSSMKNMYLVEYSDSESEEEAEAEIGHEDKKSVEHYEPIQKVDENESLERILFLCEELYLSISKLYQKGLFPFNPQPLLRLLNLCSQNIE